MSHNKPSAEMRACIDECNACRDICTECVTHCLSLGGEHAQPDHVRTLLDCADICATSSGFMLRGSDLHIDVCGVCADVCGACASSCEELYSDEMMTRCAAACRRCAESCQRMAGMVTS